MIKNNHMEMQFIGRTRELNYLREKYRAAGQQLLIVHGRRRVGKSTILRKFVQEVGGKYHQAIESSEKDQLKFLSSQLSFLLDGYEQIFDSLNKLLEYLFIKLEGKDKKTVLVIDEFPFYTNTMKSFPSLLQLFLDQDESRNLMIILCGSEISTMQQLMGIKSPLYGRKTGSLMIEPFKFLEISEFFPDTDINTLMSIYGVLGGMPNYLQRYDTKLSFNINMKNLFFNPGDLKEEYINILKYEFSSTSNYNAILRAISNGNTRINSISNETGIDARLIPKYLNDLMSIGLIRKIVPVDSKIKSRLTQYRIKDYLISFHHRFFAKLSDISSSFTDIEDDFSGYMGYVFERICKEVLIELNSYNLLFLGKKPFKLRQLGNWWKSDIEIDLVGIGEVGIVVECKYGNTINGNVIMKSLQSKLPFTPWKGYKAIIIARNYKNKTKNCFTFEELYFSLNNGTFVTLK